MLSRIAHVTSKRRSVFLTILSVSSLDDADDCAPKTLARPKRIRPAVGSNVNVPNDSYYPPGNLTTLISIDEK
jgi:hypothetical protein